MKEFRTPLDPLWAEALLSTPYGSGQTYAQRLEKAQKALREAVQAANEILRDNPLSPTVAAAAARQAHRRGDCSLVVDPDGKVMLVVRPPENTLDSWTTVLPTIESLREDAEALGVDVSTMGRSKKAILAAIQTAKEKSQAPARKMVRYALSITSPEVVQFPAESEIPEIPFPSPRGRLQALANESEEIDLSSILENTHQK